MQCDCVRRVWRNRKCNLRASVVNPKSTANRRCVRQVTFSLTLICKDPSSCRLAREHRVEQHRSHIPTRVLLRDRVARSRCSKEFFAASHTYITSEFVRITRADCHIAQEFVRVTRAVRYIAREFVRCIRAERHIISVRNRARAAVQGASHRVHLQSYPRVSCT